MNMFTVKYNKIIMIPGWQFHLCEILAVSMEYQFFWQCGQ